jgi:hypothetical protein
MKYAKELDLTMKNFPLHERIFLISYRKWKKIRPGPFWKARLAVEVFISPVKLLDVNLKTVYKLCKRFEKRFDLHDAKWFGNMISKIVSTKSNETMI